VWYLNKAKQQWKKQKIVKKNRFKLFKQQQKTNQMQ